MFGIVLGAVIDGRLTLPCGGRGTDRDIDEEEDVIPPDRPPVEGAENDRTLLCGGRGTLRPAGPGGDVAIDCRPSGARPAAEVALLRAIGEASLCEAEIAADG